LLLIVVRLNDGIIKVSKVVFSFAQMDMVERNFNMEKVSDRTISYDLDFKVKLK